MSKTRKLLWVEDDYKSLDALLLPVEKQGVKVVGCSSYSEAIDIVERESFDFFLIDLILPFRPLDSENHEPHDHSPENDLPWYWGLALIRLLKAKYAVAPVIVFSVVFDSNLKLQLRELGVITNFVKGTQSNAELCEKILELCKPAVD